ncbi:MAG TPA: transposase [Bacteroidetes bacterium]|nr:transposase [Bacteroidota bacterium]
MQKVDSFYPNCFYHIYNRGNNRENIFIETANYRYFLDLVTKYICPIAEIFAYCLLKNHFHFLVRLKTFEVLKTSKVYSQAFSNLFNSYAKAINKRYNRTGSLFQTRFGRKQVKSDGYLVYLIHYIHFNPQKHGLVKDFRHYAHSSYRSILSVWPTRVEREQVIELFGDRTGFRNFHEENDDFSVIQNLVEEN